MTYHFTSALLVDDGLYHFAEEGETWQEAYNKALNFALNTPYIDSGCVEFDLEYYKAKSFFNYNGLMASFVFDSKKDFLAFHTMLTEEEYFATQVVAQHYFLEERRQK